MREREDWRNGAACAQISPDLWFPEKSESHKVATAINICNTCPVKKQCLNYAIDNGIREGIFGGKSAEARRYMRRLAG